MSSLSGVTTEYPAPETYTLRIRGYADTQWSWTTPPPNFLGVWVSGYVDTRIRSGVGPPLPPKFWSVWVSGYADTQWS